MKTGQIALPRIHIASQQRSVSFDSRSLESTVRAAVPHCLACALKMGGPLSGLDQIEMTVIGNRAMARVHWDFLNIPGTTDVITFPYGEILVCASVARQRAKEFGHDVTTELALYCIHGLLHLAGLDDGDKEAAERMRIEQERILRLALASRK